MFDQVPELCGSATETHRLHHTGLNTCQGLLHYHSHVQGSLETSGLWRVVCALQKSQKPPQSGCWEPQNRSGILKARRLLEHQQV